MDFYLRYIKYNYVITKKSIYLKRNDFWLEKHIQSPSRSHNPSITNRNRNSIFKKNEY